MGLFISGRYARYNVTAQTGAYNAQPGDLVLCSTNSFTVTLPSAAGNNGQSIKIEKTDSDTTKIITISPNLNGASRALYTQYESVEVISDGSTWQVLEHKCDTEWAAYTPTLVGFGTIAGGSVFLWRRSGDTLKVIGAWQNGTVTSTEARVPFPQSLITDANKLTGGVTQVGGVIHNSGTGEDGLIYWVLAQPPNGYVVFTRSDKAFVVQLSASIFNTSESQKIQFEVPISGWWI